MHLALSRSSARFGRLLSLTSLLALLPLVLRAQTVIPGTTTTTTTTLTSGSHVINSGTTYELTSSADNAAIRLNGTNISLSIQGTLQNDAPLSTNSDGAALRVTGGSGVTGISVLVGNVGNASATILSKGNDAVKFTAVGTSAASPNLFTNYGLVRSEGTINTSGGSPETYTASDGITLGTSTQLNNYGTVSGARHGVDGGTITGVTVNNYAGGSLIGRNGSGIGGDTTATTAGSYLVNNWGIIRGEYAGAGNITNRQGVASVNGDGDGVDLDGAATITNYGGGQIVSTGAGGYDSGNRANNSEAISIGGGVITNDGLISGAGRGIVINNDSVASRSGVAATTITNNASGVIEGQSGFAIRLENKLGDARDNDTIVNAGTIIGNGTIPNPSDVITLQGGGVDTNSSGTLNGVTYTGTGSSRFIRGDGSAIQTGEGDDTLTNTGTITGNTGLAVNLEGGNDTLNYNAGTIAGAIDGGVGTNTLNLGSSLTHASATKNFQNINVASGSAALGGTVSGTSLTKGGAGTLILTTANDYTGGTTVAAGKLVVNNTTGSGTGTGSVFVQSGAALGGSGLISGLLTVDGIIAPGNSIGTLTVLNDVVWNGTGSNQWAFELAGGTDADLLNVGGNFTKGTGSTFTFDFLNSANAGKFTLIDWSGSTSFLASDFSYTNLGGGLTGSFAFNGSQLEFTAIPEPSTYAALLGLGTLGFTVWRRRHAARKSTAERAMDSTA